MILETISNIWNSIVENPVLDMFTILFLLIPVVGVLLYNRYYKNMEKK